MHLGAANLDVLATQLTAALDGPLLLYLSSATLAEAAQVSERLGHGWEDLVQRVCANHGRSAGRRDSSAIGPPGPHRSST